MWRWKGIDFDVFSSFSSGYSVDEIIRLSDISLSRCIERVQANDVELSNVDLAFFLCDVQCGIIINSSKASLDFHRWLCSEDGLIAYAGKEFVCLTVGSGVL